ncbi:MAG TPA: ABC transporter permease, partial [Longimicrobiales bacterium]|nr:ABC transporter permease [Longimicrobiales bacterium]
METLFKDLKVGVRALGRMPGSALISVLVLALGIGLCSFMFSVVYGVYYRGLDVPEANRIFALWRTQPEEDEFQQAVPVQDFADWREQQRSFSALFGVSGGVVHLGDGEVTRRYDGATVTANAFEVLRVRPILGRAFVEGDDAPGAPPNVILGYATWRDDYGLDPDVIGRPVRVSGEPAEIIGVMPEGFRFPSNDELWTPLRADPLASARGKGPRLMVMGRLRDGVDRKTAEADIASIA